MAIIITTTSSTDYMTDKDNALYPAFVDRMPYEAWNNLPTLNESRTPYFQLKATGGTNYVWSLQNGNLPTGLSLNNLGRISGTPLEEGSFTFTVRVQSGIESATKTLTLVSHPYRAKWYTDAKYGVVVHWGRFSYPKLSAITSTAAFEARAINFNGTQWADQLVAMGVKVLHFTCVWQDSYRNWPSKVPTRLELKSQRNFVKEITDACHTKGIKLVTYFPPDYIANPQNLTDRHLIESGWGDMNTGLTEELVVDQKIDGIWYDVGGAPDLYPPNYVNPNWLYWDKVLPIIRYNNPFFIFGVNPGQQRKGGSILRYPYADFTMYESILTISTNGELIEVGVPTIPSYKKIAVEATNTITNEWVTIQNFETAPVKNAKDIIEKIKLNWENDLLFMLSFPVPADGTLLHPNFKSTLEEVGAFVVANQGRSESPKLLRVGDTLTMSTTAKARIYYTLDNTKPDENSLIYTKPIPLDKNLIIKARALEVGRPLSTMEYYQHVSINTKIQNLLFSSTVNDVIMKDTAKYHRGMLFTVGKFSIILNKVGRKYIDGITNHDLIIKRYYDNYPIYGGVLFSNTEIVDNYQYVTIPDIKLDAGETYSVSFKENEIDSFASNLFTTIPENGDITIVKSRVLSAYADENPFITEKNGQFINLSYTIDRKNTSNNLAFGKKAKFRSIIGNYDLPPSGEKYFPENAIDGNVNSHSQAGNEYPYRYTLDLTKTVLVNSILIEFYKNKFSTEFNVYIENEFKEIELVYKRTNNRILKHKVVIDNKNIRYIHIDSIRPNTSNQVGDQMAIVNLIVK